jgi:hypothetical protein
MQKAVVPVRAPIVVVPTTFKVEEAAIAPIVTGPAKDEVAVVVAVILATFVTPLEVKLVVEALENI